MAWSGYYDFGLTSTNSVFTGYARMYWEVTSQSVANNTSTIKYYFAIKASNSQGTTAEIEDSMKVVWCNPYNTAEIYQTDTLDINKVIIGNNNEVRITSDRSITLSHDALGNLSLAVTTKSYRDHQTNTILYCDYIYASGGRAYDQSLTINKSKVYANITAPLLFTPAKILIAYPFTRDSSPMFTLENKLGSDVDELRARLVWSSGSTEWVDIGTAYTAWTFELTEEQYDSMDAAISSDNTLTVTYELYTKRKTDTYTDRKTAVFSASDIIPEVVGIAYDVNNTTKALTGDATKIIRGHNSVYVEAQYTLPTGTTLRDGFIRYDGNKQVNSLATTLQNIETGIINYYVQDSNGNYGSNTVHLNVVPYVNVTCDVVPTLSSEGVLTIKISGNYFNSSFGSRNNSLFVQYRYKTSSGSYPSNNAYTVVSNVTKSGNTYEAEVVISGLDYQKTYDVNVIVGDELETVEKTVRSVLPMPVFDWGKDDFNFNVTINYKGSPITNDFVVDEGVEDTWAYRKWNSGIAECWGKETQSVAINTAWGSLYSGTFPSVTFPISFNSPPVVSATLTSGNVTSAWLAAASNSPVTKNSSGNLLLVRPTSLTAAAYTVNFVVKGFWK